MKGAKYIPIQIDVYLFKMIVLQIYLRTVRVQHSKVGSRHTVSNKQCSMYDDEWQNTIGNNAKLGLYLNVNMCLFWKESDKIKKKLISIGLARILDSKIVFQFRIFRIVFKQPAIK